MPGLRPTPTQLLASHGRFVPDLIAPNLRILFVGINPGLYSAAVGHHFARPGNRFWPTLHRAGFTPRRLAPEEERQLLELGYGISNLVARATATADELSAEELRTGGRTLEEKVQRHRPAWLAFCGITAYRQAFARPKAVLGPQPQTLADARVWVLPNPSGLNAHHQLEDLARMFAELKEASRRNHP